jgi:hypothetical protein
VGVTRLQKAVAAIEEAVAARDEQRERAIKAVDARWWPTIKRLYLEYSAAADESVSEGYL